MGSSSYAAERASRGGSRPWFFPALGALACLAAGTASGLAFAGGSGEWYQGLSKPPGTPDSGVFRPVWTVLYLMMGTAAGLLANRQAYQALGFFAVQLILNLMWTPVFFGLHQVTFALGIIVPLWTAVFVTFVLARRECPTAGWLLLPYLIWTGYATYLNAALFVLN